MTAIFDGMAATLAGVFGAPVTVTRGAAAPVTVQAIFRDEPQEMVGADGRAMVTSVPVLQVPTDAALVLVFGDRVDVGARRFTVLQPTPTASPAADRMVVCILEEIGT